MSVEKLQSTRSQIAKLQTTLAELEAAGPSKAKALEAIDKAVVKEAAKIRPVTFDFSRKNASMQASGYEALAILCYFDPDTVRKKLIANLPDDDSFGLPATDKAKAIDKAHRDICKLEIQEEKLVTEIRHTGSPCARRLDIANPLVLVLKKAG